jgi:hypothetical protein
MLIDEAAAAWGTIRGGRVFSTYPLSIPRSHCTPRGRMWCTLYMWVYR